MYSCLNISSLERYINVNSENTVPVGTPIYRIENHIIDSINIRFFYSIFDDIQRSMEVIKEHTFDEKITMLLNRSLSFSYRIYDNTTIAALQWCF